jgi:hypothetical protein
LPDIEHHPLESWEAAWRHIAPLMKAEKARRRESTSTLADRRAELSHLRETLTPDSNVEELALIHKLESEIFATAPMTHWVVLELRIHKKRNTYTAERLEAITWRTRSRIKWLSIGEAPSCLSTPCSEV